MTDKQMIDKWLKDNKVTKLNDMVKDRDQLVLDVNGRIKGRSHSLEQKNCGETKDR